MANFLAFARNIMDSSWLFRLTDAVIVFFKRLFAGSVLGRFFSRPVDEASDGYKKSLFVRAFSGVFDGLGAFGAKRGAALREKSVFWRLLSEWDNFFQQSAIVRLLYRLADIEPLPKSFDKYRVLPVFASVAVVAAGAALFFTTPAYAALGLAAVIGALFAAAHPEIGVFAVIGVLPFLPTMLTAALIGYVIFCFFLHLLTGGAKAAMDPTGLSVALYVIAGLFFAFTSFTPRSSIKIALLTSLFMLAYPLLLSLINTAKKLHAAIFIFSASAAVTGLYGLYQKISGKADTTWIDTRYFGDLRMRVYSTFANPNVYGTYLLLAVPLALVMFCAAKNIFVKIIYAGISLLLLVNLVYTYSRGCYLALALAVFVFVLLVAKRLLAPFLAALCVVPFAMPSSIWNRLASITNMADSSTTYRLSIWQATLRMLKDFWISGVGQGIDAYNVAYPLYAFNNVTAPHSHNLFLQVFVETGIVGFAIFLAILALFFKAQLPFAFSLKGKANRKDKALCAAIVAAVAAFLFQGLFDYVFYNYKVLLSFFLVLGMGGALIKYGQNGAETPDTAETPGGAAA